MAYAILRHLGVDLGKMDFLGAMNLVAAPPTDDALRQPTA
jgi:hypothetical protein